MNALGTEPACRPLATRLALENADLRAQVAMKNQSVRALVRDMRRLRRELWAERFFVWTLGAISPTVLLPLAVRLIIWAGLL